MADTRIYKSDPLDRLNINFQDFQDKLVQLAYQAPGEYNQIRRVVRNSVLKDIIKYVHALVTHTLTKGKKTNADGSASATAIVDLTPAELANANKIFGAEGFAPEYSKEDVDEVAMNLSKTIQVAIEKHIINVIMPPDIFRSSLERAGKVAALKDAE
jgi:hypothetical protein